MCNGPQYSPSATILYTFPEKKLLDLEPENPYFCIKQTTCVCEDPFDLLEPRSKLLAEKNEVIGRGHTAERPL